ncbi:hypothetical protein GT039_10215 [Streptomyces sp. SID2955]|nr:hypothetical protein [Streptomyces sp. SID2955]
MSTDERAELHRLRAELDRLRAELHSLRAENKRLREADEVLKSATISFAGERDARNRRSWRSSINCGPRDMPWTRSSPP